MDEPIVLMPLGNHIQRKVYRSLITTDPMLVKQVRPGRLLFVNKGRLTLLEGFLPLKLPLPD